MKQFSFLLLLAFGTPALGLAFTDTLSVAFSGDTVKIWDRGAHENCAARFDYSIGFLDSNEIVITETDTVKDKAYCLCYFDLCIALGLGHDTMEVSVYRAYQTRFGYPKDTTIHIGSLRFVPPAEGTVSHSLYQSLCYYPPVGVSGGNQQLPAEPVVSNNYPNPFNPSTTIRFTLPHETRVKISVYDPLGRELRVLTEGPLSAGDHEMIFRAEGLPSGLYYYRIMAGRYSITNKMLLVK